MSKIEIISDGTLEGTSALDMAGKKAFGVESVGRSGEANNPNSIHLIVDLGRSEAVEVDEAGAAATVAKSRPQKKK